jgi:predicted metal-binding protein
MTDATTLLICTRCRAAGADPDAPRAGEALLHALAAADLPAGISVAGVACISACKRGCAVALVSEGKVSYVFGDLAPDAPSAADLITVALAHQACPIGHLPRAQRPERLRAGILSRIPPLTLRPPGVLPVITWPA